MPSKNHLELWNKRISANNVCVFGKPNNGQLMWVIFTNNEKQLCIQTDDQELMKTQLIEFSIKEKPKYTYDYIKESMRNIEIIMNEFEHHMLIFHEKCKKDFREYHEYISNIRKSTPSFGVLNAVSALNKIVYLDKISSSYEIEMNIPSPQY